MYPEYDYTTFSTRDKLTGYTVSNSIKVESDNLNNISDWVDAAALAGATRVSSIVFYLSDENLTQAKRSLIKDALSNARMKAEAGAESEGLRIVGVKSMEIEGSDTYSPYSYDFYGSSLRGESRIEAPSSSTPIKSGEESLSTDVSVVYIIGK